MVKASENYSILRMKGRGYEVFSLLPFGQTALRVCSREVDQRTKRKSQWGSGRFGPSLYKGEAEAKERCCKDPGPEIPETALIVQRFVRALAGFALGAPEK